MSIFPSPTVQKSPQQFVLTAAETRSRRRKSGIKVHNPLEISEGSISEPLVGMDNPTFTIRDEVLTIYYSLYC